MCATEAQEGYKQSLLRNSGPNLKSQSNDGTIDSEGHQVSEGKRDSIRNWATIHLCYILEKTDHLWPMS